jgi:PKD repeat protein
MKTIYVLIGIALSMAAQASAVTPVSSLIARLGRSLVERKATTEPLLHIDGNSAVQGSEFNLFARPLSGYAGSYVVIDAVMDGNPVALEHPTQDLWIFNQAQFERIATHTIVFSVSLESASQADQISSGLSQLQGQIQTLQLQIANTTDANQLAQLQATLNEKIALQSQLTAQLISLKNAIGTQSYSFTVAPAPSNSATFPRITSVAPTLGATSGGTALTIIGANFTNGLAVSIGGIPATNVAVLSSTSITATSPSFTSDGAKDIKVSLPLASGETEPKEALLTNGFFATSTPLGGLLIPVAITGAPQTVSLGAAAALIGGQSVAPSGHALNYAWSLISKPSGSSLATGATFATTANTSATPDYPGSYVFQLLATDTSTGTVSAPSLTVVTANIPNASLTATAPAITMVRNSTASSQVTVADANSPYLKFSYYITQAPLYGPVSVSSSGLVTYHELSTNTAVLVDLIGVTVVDNAIPQNSFTVTIPVTITASTLPSYSGTGCTRQSNTAPYLVYCGANGFSAPNGSIASVIWNYGDGTPNQPIVLTGTSIVGYPHYYPTFGTFYEEITVTDNLGALSNFLFKKTFSNSAIPTASFTLSSVSGTAPFAVTANATASSSPVNSTLTYRWIWGDGTAAETGTGAAFATRSHTYSGSGTFKPSLAVTDTLGNFIQNTGTVYVGVAVPATGSPPSAFADITSTRWQTVNTPITFNGSNYSMDANPAGGIASYTWNYGDYSACPSNGCNDTGANVSHAYSQPMNYFMSLTAKNALGGASVTQYYEVASVTRGLPPRAMFNLARTSGVAPFSISVDGSSSFDYDGSIVSYDWKWGDGTADSSTTASSHTYTAPGTYFPSLTVVDNDGNAHNNTQMITITATMRIEPRDGEGDGDDDQTQILTSACAQGNGAACDQLAKIFAAKGDSVTAANLEIKACGLNYQPACSGR